LSSINFPRESKRILGSLAERRKPFYGVATAALLPHMANREVRKIIDCICAGKIGFNDSNDLGGPLAKHLNGQNLTYFMDTLDHAVFPESGNDDHFRHGIETVISALSVENQISVREWSRTRHPTIRSIVADAIEKSEAREDLEFLVEQWMLGVSHLPFSLYTALRFGNNPYKQHVFAFTEERLIKFRHWLLGPGKDRRWTIELLKITARQIPSWSNPIASATEVENDPFVRRAFQLCSKKYHEKAVAEILYEAQTEKLSSHQLVFLKVLDVADWNANWGDAMKLLLSPDIELVVAVGDELASPVTGARRALSTKEIDDIIDRLGFWNSYPGKRDAIIPRERLISIVSEYIDVLGCKHIIARANNPMDKLQKDILCFVIPSISNTLVTTEDLTGDACRLMLEQYVTHPLIEALSSSPGRIATERFIDEVVLPSIAQFTNKSQSKKRIEKILLDAGNRHGRRYRISAIPAD
jgi:hypothetical protein